MRVCWRGGEDVRGIGEDVLGGSVRVCWGDG